jgi:hypothetical protein
MFSSMHERYSSFASETIMEFMSPDARLGIVAAYARSECRLSYRVRSGNNPAVNARLAAVQRRFG